MHKDDYRAHDLLSFSTENQTNTGGANININLLLSLCRKIIVAHVLFISDELFQNHYQSKTVPWLKGQEEGEDNRSELG